MHNKGKEEYCIYILDLVQKKNMMMPGCIRDKFIILEWGQGKFLASMFQTIEMTTANQNPKKMTIQKLIKTREQEA